MQKHFLRVIWYVPYEKLTGACMHASVCACACGSRLRVGEPRGVGRRDAGGHHVGQRAHAVVELAAHLVAQVVAVVVLGGRHEEIGLSQRN
eukprot:6188641-Pleurochrysis_carterae.AAC.2